jgi:hypothetical protein
MKFNKKLATLVEFTLEKKKIKKILNFFVEKWQNFVNNFFWGIVETQVKRVGNLELELIRLKEELQGNNKAMHTHHHQGWAKYKKWWKPRIFLFQDSPLFQRRHLIDNIFLSYNFGGALSFPI